MARAGMIGALQDIEAGIHLLPQPASDPQPLLSGRCPARQGRIHCLQCLTASRCVDCLLLQAKNNITLSSGPEHCWSLLSSLDKAIFKYADRACGHAGSCLWDALMPAVEALAEAIATAAQAADEGAQWLLQVSAAEQQAARWPPCYIWHSTQPVSPIACCLTYTCACQRSISGLCGP